MVDKQTDVRVIVEHPGGLCSTASSEIMCGLHSCIALRRLWEHGWVDTSLIGE